MGHHEPYMRIFVYLLALLTGLSATQSAEARHASLAEQDVASAIWDTGEDEDSLELAVSASGFSVNSTPRVTNTATQKSNYTAPAKIRVVYRGDRARE